MPRRRRFHQPPSLREASLQNIACHFESYWTCLCAGNRTTLLDYRSLSKCLEAFEYLSDDIIQDLLNILAQKSLLERHHFQFLLSSNVRHLELCLPLMDVNHYSINAADHFSVVQTVGVRCQKLTHLSLSGLSTVKDYVLRKLVTNLPQLISLNLDYTRTNFKVLKAVAENCPNLLELCINRCLSKRGQDYDIQEFANLCKMLGVPQLKAIDFYYSSRVSVNTVAALLNSQRRLQTLRYMMGHIDHVFGQMYGEEFQRLKDVPPEWMCDLSSLNIDGYGKRGVDLGLELTLRCCPFVTELQLNDLSDNTVLTHVSKLRHLRVLLVRVAGEKHVSFTRDLLPVLMELGKNFVSVMFANVSEVSVMTIGKLCPNLESLTLNLINKGLEQYSVGGNTAPCFKSLTNLQLGAYWDSNLVLSEELVFNTLGNAAGLRKMTLCRSEFTDKTISKVNDIHGFRHLETAVFCDCTAISVETGMVLLSSDNPLESIAFYRCNHLTTQDKNRLAQEVAYMDCDVQIDVHSY